MITVGFDFGTHQTKVCYEKMESGTPFYEVFRFKKQNGEDAVTLPSYIRLGEDGRLRYGYMATSEDQGGSAITYFKQTMFSWSAHTSDRVAAERWSILYLAFVIFKLDEHFMTTRYVIQMGMPTDADPSHYEYCKLQAVRVMASAMQLAREVFANDLNAYLGASYEELSARADECMATLPRSVHEVRRKYPIFVFPEAYVALIPLINDRKLPAVGPNLFVDIGGGTVDISLFTNQMDFSTGQNRPCLYYYHSVPYGLNMITGQDLKHSHNVEVRAEQITRRCVDGFGSELKLAVDQIVLALKKSYVATGRSSVMPFANLSGQVMQGRPICYSGGGSMFHGLRQPVSGTYYNFSQVTTVAALIDHSKLYVDDRIFHVLATAFALSHQSLLVKSPGVEPDSIRLVSVERLFDGVRLPRGNTQVGLDRINIIPPNPTHGVRTDLLEDIARDAERGHKTDLQRKADEERELSLRLAGFEARRSFFQTQISGLKGEYRAGYDQASIKLAVLYLKQPGFGSRNFELARDWLNKAREKRYVDLGLLKLFERVCANNKNLSDVREHHKRYCRLIERYNSGEFKDWNCVSIASSYVQEIQAFC
jgi:hypothetical protein